MMMRELLPDLQQSLPTLCVAPHTACTLGAARHRRWLLILAGRLWVTGLPTEARAGDLFLGVGESVEVPAGVSPVVECLPEARGAVPQAARLLWVEADPASSARPADGRTAAGARGRHRPQADESGAWHAPAPA